MTEGDQGAVRLGFQCAEVICFAMEHAGVPIVREIIIENRSPEALVGAELCVQLLPDLGREQVHALPRLEPGSRHSLDTVDFRLEPTRLRTLKERERAQLRLRIRRGSEPLAEVSRSVDVLAFNEWPGTKTPLGLVTAFALPNHSAVPAILRAVSDRLGATTGVSAIDEYQSGSRRRVVEQLRALYDVLRAAGLNYAPGPASFEVMGQKVRLIDDVLEQKLANCLDISLFCVGVMEAMGLRPLLVLERGHAFAGVWLKEERFPEGLVEDTARLRTLRELGQIELFDPTVALVNPDRPLELAAGTAWNRIAEEENFVAALDVRVIRSDGFRPLAVRDAGP
jgi:hypothetical protein